MPDLSEVSRSPDQMNACSLLRLDSVSVRLSGELILDRVTLGIAPGEVVALLGQNGSGKSTVLRTALGLLGPEEGDVWLFGRRRKPPFPSDVLARIGAVLEHPGVYDGLTVQQNLTFFARIYDVPDHETRIHDLLFAVGLVDRLQTRVDQLSRGLRQRLSIVRALLPEPELLLLDEPASGLDGRARSDVVDMLRDLLFGSRAGIVIAAPLFRDVDAIATRAVVLDGGVIIADRPFEQIADAVAERSFDSDASLGRVLHRLL